MKKESILGIALSSILIATTAEANEQTVTQEVEKCFGIQKAKGLNGCAVDQSEIKAANAAFKNKYKKSTVFDCSGNVEGSAKQGHLAWIYVARGSCLKIEGGFLIEKGKDGNLVVDKG